LKAAATPEHETYLKCVLSTALFNEMEANPPPPMVAAFDEPDNDIPFDAVLLPTPRRETKPSRR
jgi:hypothetical protein